MEEEIYAFEKYPLTKLLRLVNKAIANGDDEFQLEIREYYGDKEYFITTNPK